MDRLHKMHLIERKATWWVHMVRVETCKETNNFTCRQCMARYAETHVWCSEKESKTKMDIEKPQVDNWEEYSLLNQTMKSSSSQWKPLGESWKFRCQQQVKSSGETHRSIVKRKTKYACVVNADESTRPRLEGTIHKHHQNHITEKRMNSLNHYSVVHKFIPMPQAMKNPDVKAVVAKEWENWRQFRMAADEGQKQERGDQWSKEKSRKVHFASMMDLWHLKNSELESLYQKYRGRVVLRGGIVKDDSGSYAVFTEQGPSASKMGYVLLRPMST